jgi:hypothetical protein
MGFHEGWDAKVIKRNSPATEETGTGERSFDGAERRRLTAGGYQFEAMATLMSSWLVTIDAT